MKSPLLTSLACAALMVGAVASLALAGSDEPAPTPRREQVTVRKVKLGSDAEPGSQRVIVLKSRVATGEAPNETAVVMAGDGGTLETIDLSTLADGETRVISSGSGRVVELAREDGQLVVRVDGETVNIAGGPGTMDENVQVLGPGGAHGRVMQFIASDGTVTQVGGGDAPDHDVVWVTSEGEAHGDGGHHFIVKTMAPSLRIDPAKVDFDSLESLKGLDKRNRERVIAALKEILANPALLDLDVDVDVTSGEPGQDGSVMLWNEKAGGRMQ